MPQTVKILRTVTNNPPGVLAEGALSAEMGGFTRLWLGTHTGNRLLISDNPTDLPTAGIGYLPLSGGQLSGGINFGNAVAGAANDLSRHISLHTAGYGFSVTPNTLNIVTGNTTVFWAGGNWLATLNTAGLTMGDGRALLLALDPAAPMHASTRQYVDARAWQEAPDSTYTYGRKGNAWVGVPPYVAYGDVGLDLDTLMDDWPALVSVTNQTAPLNFPPGQNTGFILRGRNSNGGWQDQLFMGGRLTAGATPPIWFRGNVDGGWSRWFQLLSDQGGTLLAPLTLAADPTQPLHCASKRYVDAHDPAFGNYLPIGGGVLLGELGIDAAGIRYNGSNAIAFAWNGNTVEALVDGAGLPGALATQQFALDQDAAIYNWTSANFLPLWGGNLSGTLEAQSVLVRNGVYLSDYNGWEWLLSTDLATGDKYQTYRAGGWFDLWRSVDGARLWFSNNQQVMSLNAAGDLWVAGVLSCDALVIEPDDTYQLYVASDGVRWTQYYPTWGWGWNPVNADLVWANGWYGPGYGAIIGADGICFNAFGVWYAMIGPPPLDAEDYTPGLDAIMQVRPCTYQAEARDGAPARRRVGVVAQEIETVIPEAVMVGARGLGADQQAADQRFYDSSPLLYTLVNAVKELNARVTAGGL